MSENHRSSLQDENSKGCIQRFWFLNGLPVWFSRKSSFEQFVGPLTSVERKIDQAAWVDHAPAVLTTWHCKLDNAKKKHSPWVSFNTAHFFGIQHIRACVLCDIKLPYLYDSKPIPTLPNLKVHSIANPAGFLYKVNM
jgi:hypothetical protein